MYLNFTALSSILQIYTQRCKIILYVTAILEVPNLSSALQLFSRRYNFIFIVVTLSLMLQLQPRRYGTALTTLSTMLQLQTQSFDFKPNVKGDVTIMALSSML